MKTLFLREGTEERTVTKTTTVKGIQKTYTVDEPFKVNYYITSLNKEQYDMLLDYHKRKQLGVLSDLFRVNCRNHKLVGAVEKVDGNLTISGKISKYLGSFVATTSGEKQTHYRDYTRSKEEQKDKAWLINICPHYTSSWRTVMMALNEPSYILIWWDYPTKTYENVRQFTPNNSNINS